jgi:membrane-associated protein
LGKVLGAKQIEKVVYLIIFISVLPLFIGAIRHRMAAKKEAQDPAKLPASSKGALANGEKGNAKDGSAGKASAGETNNVSHDSVGE